ncbi:MAG: ROK family protein [Solobacterium sp.]|nr:ROK family protein [Solobacterium sp.]
MNYLVFDWGGTFLKYAIMNEETDILEKSKVPAPSVEASVEEMLERIDPIVEQYRDSVQGIAISMPGMLNDRNGYCRTAGSLRFFTGITVGTLLHERYHLPVSVQNDGKSAVLAEHWKGALQGCKDCAVIVIGTGIGGGIILNDRLLVGKDFSAGEYSFLNTNDSITDSWDGYWCRNGHTALGEYVASKTGESPDTLNGIEIFRRIREDDDPIAKEALRHLTDAYAVQIYNLAILLDLERIAIGGGISEDPLLMEYLYDSIRKMRSNLPFEVYSELLPEAEVVVCRYHNDANLIGALYHHLYGEWENR